MRSQIEDCHAKPRLIQPDPSGSPQAGHDAIAGAPPLTVLLNKARIAQSLEAMARRCAVDVQERADYSVSEFRAASRLDEHTTILW